jgi:hypothetical protein
VGNELEEYCCKPLKIAIDGQFIQQPPKIESNPFPEALIPRGYFITDKTNYMYINNCPFCGEKLKTKKNK